MHTLLKSACISMGQGLLSLGNFASVLFDQLGGSKNQKQAVDAPVFFELCYLFFSKLSLLSYLVRIENESCWSSLSCLFAVFIELMKSL